MNFSHSPHSSTQHPQQCPACGSTFFQDGQFRQYLAFTSGGGIRPSEAVWQIKICVCGHPMPPVQPRQPDASYRSLLESLQQAWDLRAGMQGDQILSELDKRFVTASQFQVLEQWLARLAKMKDTPQDVDPEPDPLEGLAQPE